MPRAVIEILVKFCCTQFRRVRRVPINHRDKNLDLNSLCILEGSFTICSHQTAARNYICSLGLMSSANLDSVLYLFYSSNQLKYSIQIKSPQNTKYMFHCTTINLDYLIKLFLQWTNDLLYLPTLNWTLKLTFCIFTLLLIHYLVCLSGSATLAGTNIVDKTWLTTNTNK